MIFLPRFEFTENISTYGWLAAGSIPALTLEATIEPGPGFDITLPALTSEATCLTGEVATVAQTLPVLTLEATAQQEPYLNETLPALTIEAWISTGWTFAERIPEFTLTSTVLRGEIAEVDADLPALTIEASSGADARLTLPLPTLSANLAPGQTATCDLALPLPTVASTAVDTVTIEADASIPLPAISAQIMAGSVVTAALTVPKLQLAATGVSGSVSTILAALPLLEVVSEGSTPGSYTVDETLPALQLVAEAVQTITEAIATSQTWVLNLRNGAMTEYTNWAFNSLAYFNGKYLGAGEGGIFELGVQDHEDNTTDIPARARTGKHDMESSFLKRLPYGYLDCEADGDVVVSTLTSEDGQRDYLVPWNGNTAVQNRRINFGRGPKSKHWQFEFANREGSHFRIAALDSMPRRSHRRVQ